MILFWEWDNPLENFLLKIRQYELSMYTSSHSCQQYDFYQLGKWQVNLYWVQEEFTLIQYFLAVFYKLFWRVLQHLLTPQKI